MSFTEYMDDFWEDRAKNIQLGIICKVVKFDSVTMRADVQPLMKIKNALDVEIDYPILSDLPVLFFNAGGFYIRPQYQVNDFVYVSFTTFDMSDSLKGYIRAESEKIFSIENAVVVCGLAKAVYQAPAEFSNPGLLIGHESGASYIKFAADSITFVFGSEEIKMSALGIQFSTFNLKTHTHTSAAPGSPTTPPTPGS